MARLAVVAVVVMSLGLPLGGLALAMWPQSPLYGTVHVHGDRDEKIVALTFDDGPNRAATLALAGVMESRGVRGTFFLVGSNVERDPATVAELVRRGHVVGDHSWRHQKRDAMFDFDYEEAGKTQAAIEAAAGVCTALFRAPNGFHTPWQLRAVRDFGMHTVAWDVQTYDWENPPAAEIVADVLAQIEPGSIVLLHDGNDLDQDVARPETVEAVGEVIDRLTAEGYSFTTVDQLLGIPAYAESC